MSDLTKNLEAALMKESLQDRTFAVLMTLGEEYEAKAITQERFASRVIETLLLYAKAVKRDISKHSQETP